eukprot:TRINITY_DN10108_c0_g1_i2.p1 TRINITY_DN10108_c0_g1~~TRINITY_DN10108_c0_g1_i2.p1  ORF type:complete len:104 (+),score=6.05 TRINITY_DN10108_c0_g1_i2:134-445(+)
MDHDSSDVGSSLLLKDGKVFALNSESCERVLLDVEEKISNVKKDLFELLSRHQSEVLEAGNFATNSDAQLRHLESELDRLSAQIQDQEPGTSVALAAEAALVF